MAQKYGKWIVARSLSEGGQAVTFLAYREDDPEKRQCVLKRFKNPDRVKRYESEVAAALSLDHPNLVKYVDSDLESAKPFMVTEYYSGGPLSRGNFDNWSTIERLQLFRAICDGVGYAHSQGIIHRDLKPDNIFLHKDGKTPVVGDFGICFISEEGTRFTLTDEAVGSRRFTAPELEDGRAGQVSARSDVYSLGKILYWLFAKRVFDREKHREPQWSLTNKQQDLSAVLIAERAFVNELLDQAVVHEPEKRCSNANHFGANVDRAIWRILRHAHTLDLTEYQICNFCGIGDYQAVGDSTCGSKPYGVGEVDSFGVRRVGRAEWLVLWCNHCGHVQYFRTDTLRAKNQDPWRNRGA